MNTVFNFYHVCHVSVSSKVTILFTHTHTHTLICILQWDHILRGIFGEGVKKAFLHLHRMTISFCLQIIEPTNGKCPQIPKTVDSIFTIFLSQHKGKLLGKAIEREKSMLSLKMKDRLFPKLSFTAVDNAGSLLMFQT